jgi:hypothetical protein
MLSDTMSPSSRRSVHRRHCHHHRERQCHLIINTRLQASEAHGASLLNVSAMTLANLCVAYIMISDNEKAEEVTHCVSHAMIDLWRVTWHRVASDDACAAVATRREGGGANGFSRRKQAEDTHRHSQFGHRYTLLQQGQL